MSGGLPPRPSPRPSPLRKEITPIAMQLGDIAGADPFSLGAPSLKVIRKENTRGNIETFTVGATGLKEGKYEERTAKGKLVYQCNYTNDALDGPSDSYYDNGKDMSNSFFIKGRLHGESRHWYPNGTPKVLNTYVGGKLHGLQQCWHMNGIIWTEYTKVNGEFHGSYKIYDASGELYEQKTFREGVLHGMATKKIDSERFEEILYSSGILLSRKIKNVSDATFDLDYIASLAYI